MKAVRQAEGANKELRIRVPRVHDLGQPNCECQELFRRLQHELPSMGRRAPSLFCKPTYVATNACACHSYINRPSSLLVLPRCSKLELLQRCTDVVVHRQPKRSAKENKQGRPVCHLATDKKSTMKVLEREKKMHGCHSRSSVKEERNTLEEF